MITFTRLTKKDYKIDTETVSEIRYKCKSTYIWEEPLAFIQRDCNGRVVVFIVGDDLYYADGDNLTIRRVIEALKYTNPITTYTEGKCEVLDELVINASSNIILVKN